MAKRQGCMRAAYKQALKDVARQMGYSRTNRVPKHVRKDLRIYAEDMAKRICNTKRRR